MSKEGVAPEARKLEAHREWSLHKSATDMLSYLGFCNYYRALITDFSELAVPVYTLGQAALIHWTPDLSHAFEPIRQAVLNAPILRLHDPDRPFALETEASSAAGGAVLNQSDGTAEYPVGFYSMALSKPERNYSAYERELLALLKAVSHFAIYLRYEEFTWRTDHAALRNLFRAYLTLSSLGSRWILARQP